MHRQDAHLGAAIGIEVALDLAAARFEPAQETLQRRGFGALVLQRARQQFVDRVGRLMSQPFEQSLPSALGTERLGEEVEGRREVRAPEPGRQPAMRIGEGGIVRLLAQRPPEMAGALPGEHEELVLVEADQRRFEQAGEVEVVLRQQHEARHGQQILDRELLTEIEPVDACDLDIRALELADQRIHELVAPAHQHHQMARVQELAATGAAFLADQALGVNGDQPCQPLMRCAARAAGGFDVGRVDLGLVRGDQRPQLDPARRLLAARQMQDAEAGLGDAARGVVLAENPVDSIEYGRCGAERHGQLDRHERLAGELGPFLEPQAHVGELARIGALEAEDRLLGVTDGEHRAVSIDRAGADEEFLGEAADHLPLVGIGVLRLVDQHVVDSAIELVEYPGGALRALQQPAGRHDQVVVVEHGPAPLGRVIALGDVEAEPQQGQGEIDQGAGIGVVEGTAEPLGLGAQHAVNLGQQTRRCLGGQSLSHVALVGEKHRAIGIENSRAVFLVLEPGGNRLAARAVRLAGLDQRPGRDMERRFVRCILVRLVAIELLREQAAHAL